MKEFATISFLFILCITSCGQGNSSIKNEGTYAVIEDVDMENMENQQFVGSWELQEWTIESKDGKNEFPFGPDAIGQINYDINGNMSVMIMKNNRPPFITEDPLQGQSDEVVNAFKGFIAYSGKYKVNPDSKEVVHQITISSFPNWVRQNQIRKFEFNGEKLTLSTDFIGPNKHTLVWRKINF